MKKVYLMNDASIARNALREKVYEVIPMYKTDKIGLYLINDGDNYKIYRKEKISFLEDDEKEIKISGEEYEEVKGNITKDNLDETLLKHIFILSNEVTFNIYEGKFEGLVTLEKEYEDELEFAEDETINGIDITELDCANDRRLLNLTREEFEHEIAQVRMNYNIF